MVGSGSAAVRPCSAQPFRATNVRFIIEIGPCANNRTTLETAQHLEARTRAKSRTQYSDLPGILTSLHRPGSIDAISSLKNCKTTLSPGPCEARLTSSCFDVLSRIVATAPQMRASLANHAAVPGRPEFGGDDSVADPGIPVPPRDRSEVEPNAAITRGGTYFYSAFIAHVRDDGRIKGNAARAFKGGIFVAPLSQHDLHARSQINGNQALAGPDPDGGIDVAATTSIGSAALAMVSDSTSEQCQPTPTNEDGGPYE